MKLKLVVVWALSVYGCLGIDEEKSCDAQCSPSYPLHTYPKTSYNTACTRGCRLAYVDYYTSDGTVGGCNKTCNEAYTHDSGAVYACTVGCAVSLDTALNDEIAQVTMVNNLMEMLFVSRVIDMLSSSYDNEPSENASDDWASEVDVFVSEDWNSVNSSIDRTTNDVTWSVYSMVWFYDATPSHLTTSAQVDTSETSDPSNDYYLVYYKHWSLTQFGFLSQLICYLTLFLFMVALLKCCHILLSDGSDDTNKALSIQADNGYYDSSDVDDDDESDETAALLWKKRQRYMSMSDIVQKPAHTEHVVFSTSSLLPVQNTRLNAGGKVEGILTVV